MRKRRAAFSKVYFWGSDNWLVLLLELMLHQHSPPQSNHSPINLHEGKILKNEYYEQCNMVIKLSSAWEAVAHKLIHLGAQKRS